MGVCSPRRCPSSRYDDVPSSRCDDARPSRCDDARPSRCDDACPSRCDDARRRAATMPVVALRRCPSAQRTNVHLRGELIPVCNAILPNCGY
jgi:hypothetical protein